MLFERLCSPVTGLESAYIPMASHVHHEDVGAVIQS